MCAVNLELSLVEFFLIRRWRLYSMKSPLKSLNGDSTVTLSSLFKLRRLGRFFLLSKRLYSNENSTCKFSWRFYPIAMGWLRLAVSLKYRSLLQNTVSFIGLFRKRDLRRVEMAILLY